MLEAKEWLEYQDLARKYLLQAPSRMRMGGKYLSFEEIKQLSFFEAARTIINKYNNGSFNLEPVYEETD